MMRIRRGEGGGTCGQRGIRLTGGRVWRRRRISSSSSSSSSSGACKGCACTTGDNGSRHGTAANVAGQAKADIAMGAKKNTVWSGFGPDNSELKVSPLKQRDGWALS
eukprot:9470013-Pyramimonas_sp.AAC.1